MTARSTHTAIDRRIPPAALIAGLLGLLPMASAVALDAEEIFERSSPAVVQLQSLDSEGSGVLVHEKGWILTNLHVAVSGIPMTVAISDESGNIARKIDGATLHLVHPTEDLAILKFDPGKEKPTVARVAAAGQEPRPAATCFAISSPAGNDGALTNTITQGIVSTPRRKIDDREFIQFSAAVNPGSSGGALLDREGRLIGLITSKQESSEGVAFATPLAGIDWNVFVGPAKRSGSKERYQQAIEIGQRARFAGALRMFGNPGADLSEELAAAAYFARMALTEFPADEVAFRDLIEVYYLVGKQDVCLELARSAAKATGASVFLSIEGRSLDLLGKKEEAFEAYSNALSAEDGKASPRAAAAMAAMLAEQADPDWGRIAYLAKWGLVSTDAKNDAGIREAAALFERAVEHLPIAAVRAIRAKQSDFTLAEMRGFPAKLPEPPKGEAEIIRALDPAFFQPLLASSSGPLELPADRIPKEREDPDSDFVIHMEHKIDAVVPAAGGRIALLVSTEADTVYTFDILRGASISKTECEKGSLAGKWVVGGLTHWALVDKTRLRYHRFHLLKSGDPEIREPAGREIEWNCFGALMSPYRDDLLWILLRESDGRVSVAIQNFDADVIRTPDMTGVAPPLIAQWANHSHPRFRIDAAAMTCAPEVGGEIFLTIEPESFRFVPLGAGYAFGQLSFPYLDTPADWFVDARSARNLVENPMSKKWEASGNGLMGAPVWMGPVHGAPRILQLSHSVNLMVQVRDADTGESLLPLREINYRHHLESGNPRPADPKRFEVVSHRSSPRIVIFDFHANKLLSVKMKEWERMDERPLVVRRKPGTEVRVPFRPPPGTTLRFPRDDPRGITVDQETGELVITDPEPGRLEPASEFLVEAADSGDIKTYYIFQILADESEDTNE